MNALKTHVKYNRAKRAVRMNRYRHFLRQLALLVENSRLRQAQATVYQQRRQKRLISGALMNHVRHSLVKKAKVVKAIKFGQSKLIGRAMIEWGRQVAAMKRIRGDKLLWQAHTQNSEFFSVSVRVGAVLDYKQDRPVLQQKHFLLQPETASDEEQFIAVRENVKMGLGNMVSI